MQPPKPIPLHEADPTGRFTTRADSYARFRPGYPDEAIDAAIAGLGNPELLVAADIGAGTGISARLLGDRGLRVFAIEPNDAMRHAATAHPRVTWLNATAEATTLPDESVDLVIAAQAFHWFRPAESLREFARILRKPGRLVLMWNVRDDSDPFTEAYSRTVQPASERAADQGLHLSSSSVDRSGAFLLERRVMFENGQRLDFGGVLGRARSASYVPESGPQAARIEQDLRAAFDKYQSPDGDVVLRHTTVVSVYATRS